MFQNWLFLQPSHMYPISHPEFKWKTLYKKWLIRTFIWFWKFGFCSFCRLRTKANPLLFPLCMSAEFSHLYLCSIAGHLHTWHSGQHYPLGTHFLALFSIWRLTIQITLLFYPLILFVRTLLNSNKRTIYNGFIIEF